MSVKETSYYSVVCDYPGCTATAQDGDYSAWSDPSQAYEEAVDGEWLILYGDESRDYCPAHTIRSWDEEDEEVLTPAPETFSWQLKEAIERKLYRAHNTLDSAIRRLERASYEDRRRIEHQIRMDQNRAALAKFASPTAALIPMKGRFDR